MRGNGNRAGRGGVRPARLDVSAGEPLELLPGLQQEAPLRDRYGHLRRGGGGWKRRVGTRLPLRDNSPQYHAHSPQKPRCPPRRALRPSRSQTERPGKRERPWMVRKLRS